MIHCFDIYVLCVFDAISLDMEKYQGTRFKKKNGDFLIFAIDSSVLRKMQMQNQECDIAVISVGPPGLPRKLLLKRQLIHDAFPHYAESRFFIEFDCFRWVHLIHVQQSFIHTPPIQSLEYIVNQTFTNPSSSIRL